MFDRPVDHPHRIEGWLKVTGAARYTADLLADDFVHAVVVPSTVAHARVRSIDTAAARRSPDVASVVTHAELPPLAPTTSLFPKFLNDSTVHFVGQPVAVVVARSKQAAAAAATQVRVEYELLPAVTTVDSARHAAYTPKSAGRTPTDSLRGNPTEALEKSDVKVAAEYCTATNNHHPIEPHCALVRWAGDRVTVYTTTSAVFASREAIAQSFNLPLEHVRVISQFLGGSFGAKGAAWYSCLVLMVAIARLIDRPLRFELTRAQMFALVGRRQETIQRLTLGASSAGRLKCIMHHTVAQTSTYGEYADPVGTVSRMLYGCENVEVTHRLIRVNAPQPNPMRAPGESPGSFALEVAMDELAVKLGLDPLELRVRNFADHDQHEKRPWSSNGLLECYRVGAAAFGWNRRASQVSSLRDGPMQIGLGMASACYPVYRTASEASARIHADGRVVVQCGTQDVGGGTYTVLGQLAAQTIGVPLTAVTVELGDTQLPQGPPSAGSMATASFAPAIEKAARMLRQRILDLAVRDPASSCYGAAPESIEVVDGQIRVQGRERSVESIAGLLGRCAPAGLIESVRIAPEARPDYSGYSHGAVFAEVGVDPALGEVRVRRLTAAYAAGRILNRRLARSQYIGGLIAGIGMALHEATLWDQASGRVVNDNLSDYLIPVHADMPSFDIHLVEQHDAHLPAGVKGIGMIGAVGVAAAIVNAIYHACGRRLRRLPVRLEHLL